MNEETNAPIYTVRTEPVNMKRANDKQMLADMMLTSPRTGEPLTISSELQKQTDNSIRFTASTSDGGERWGIVFGITELRVSD